MNDLTYGYFASESSAAAIKNLDKNGAKFHEFPRFATELIPISDDIFSSIVDRYDWLLFSDVVSAEKFLAAVDAGGFDLLMLDSVRICAVGEAASDVLRYEQIHSDVIVPFPDAEGAAEPLFEYIGRENVPKLRFLSIKGMNRKNILADEIANAGGNVERIEVYKVSQQFIENVGRSAALISGGAIDRFIVAAMSDIVALNFLSEKSSPPFSRLDIKILAAGPAEYRFAAEAGFEPSYLSK